MARSSSAPTRNDAWICANCQAANFTADSEQHCPSCGHYQTSPSAYPQPTHVYQADHSLPHRATHDGHSDLWHCYECGADNPDWHTEQCPVCGASMPDQSRMYSMPMANSLGGAGQPAAGIWECVNCGAVNSAVHWNQCGECGYVH